MTIKKRKLKFPVFISSMTCNEYYKQLRTVAKFHDSGAFADVYRHKTNKDSVIKVGKLYYTPQRDGYLQFVQSCLNLKATSGGKDNPYLPKFYDVRIFKYDNTAKKREYQNQGISNGWGFYTVIMERLQRFPYQHADTFESEIQKAIESVSEDSKQRSVTKQLVSVTESHVKETFVPVAKMLNDLFGDYDEDLHEGNFMLRGNHPVIIDPIVSDENW